MAKIKHKLLKGSRDWPVFFHEGSESKHFRLLWQLLYSAIISAAIDNM